MTISRRRFARTLAVMAGAAAAAAEWPFRLGCETAQSPVAFARSDSLKRMNDDIDERAATRLLNLALETITGKKNPAEAWKSLFSAHETVGVKLSCLPGRKLSSSRGVVAAIVAGLRSAGVAPERIIVWERTRRELERAGFGSAVSGAPVVATDDRLGGGYSESLEFQGGVGTCFSRLMERVDALVNVPVLKDHDIAGLSFGMKNFFGAIYNPNKYHANRCDPFVADVCAHPLVCGKLRLVIGDASRIQVHGGPAFSPSFAREYGALLVGRDPVAVDFTGWQIVESLRQEMRLPSLRDAGREPTYIMTASRQGLGRAGAPLIRRIEIKDPSGEALP